MSGGIFCPVPWTGQETCHDEHCREIACAGSDQNAEIQYGQGWPQPRFEARGDTVLDRLAGLIWSRDANPAEVVWGGEAPGAVLCLGDECEGARMNGKCCYTGIGMNSSI